MPQIKMVDVTVEIVHKVRQGRVIRRVQRVSEVGETS